MNIFSNNINLLQRALDVSSLRQKVLSNNISNVDTPGYKTLDVSFEDILKNEQEKSIKIPRFKGYRTDPRHIAIGSQMNDLFQPKIVVQNQTSIFNHENNVDIESEMTKLAENNLWYNTLTQVTNKEFGMLRYVITEGRR
ncbi:flagellar basal body rod protein FlgB [Tepidibacillus infernus]|uniref:Flagellar basal body rod protein FlgB n=1 Tax=Tepidibacillus decaturensis TaxID=1413211 RepID=A0A135L351_9BACI|nr:MULTISPECIES: flagellar basal body rod protein FlgB [Tepidibacillus]KXG43380.1 hypothetical protein U473_04650 [Tepidibacillus decaturensis]GBF11595.1 flagellar basal body rod protein FlgB [Tepidibacillus sp. HK-1]